MTTKKKWNKDIEVYPEIIEVRERGEGVSGPATAGRAGGDPLGATVEAALRQTLGWRPRAGDVDGFRAAMDQAIVKTEVEGQTRWKWQAPTTIIRVEGGAVTGAQASIFSRMQAAVDQSQPLLSGLKALIPDPDQEDVEASRAIVANTLNELVNEMGIVGGPRPQRVDELFAILLGEKPAGGYQYNPENVPGQLGLLQKRMGLVRGRVNTIEEERNLTNFLILVDYVMTLQRNWDDQRGYFERGSTEVYLGTQLVHLTRYLGVIAEQAQEVAYILDSVYVDDAERQSIELPGTTPPLTITELLTWVDHFAAVEGPYLIQDGGKDGVIAMTPTLRKLEELTTQAARIAGKPKDNPAPGVHTPRVERSFSELAQHLQKAIELAEVINRFSRPTLNKPDDLSTGKKELVILKGSGFQDNPAVTLIGTGLNGEITRIIADPVTFLNKESVKVGFDLIDIDADEYQDWIVQLVNPDSGAAEVPVVVENPEKPDQGPAPRLDSPPPFMAGSSQKYTLTGGGFQRDPDAPKVQLRGYGPNNRMIQISAHSVSWVSDDEVEAVFDLTEIDPANAERWELRLINHDGGVATVKAAVSKEDIPPVDETQDQLVVIGAYPQFVQAGEHVMLTIHCTGPKEALKFDTDLSNRYLTSPKGRDIYRTQVHVNKTVQPGQYAIKVQYKDLEDTVQVFVVGPASRISDLKPGSETSEQEGE